MWRTASIHEDGSIGTQPVDTDEAEATDEDDLHGEEISKDDGEEEAIGTSGAQTSHTSSAGRTKRTFQTAMTDSDNDKSREVGGHLHAESGVVRDRAARFMEMLRLQDLARTTSPTERLQLVVDFFGAYTPDGTVPIEQKQKAELAFKSLMEDITALESSRDKRLQSIKDLQESLSSAKKDKEKLDWDLKDLEAVRTHLTELVQRKDEEIISLKEQNKQSGNNRRGSPKRMTDGYLDETSGLNDGGLHSKDDIVKQLAVAKTRLGQVEEHNAILQERTEELCQENAEMMQLVEDYCQCDPWARWAEAKRMKYSRKGRAKEKK